MFNMTNQNNKLRKELRQIIDFHSVDSMDDGVEHVLERIHQEIKDKMPKYKQSGMIDGVPASDKLDDCYNQALSEVNNILDIILE